MKIKYVSLLCLILSLTTGAFCFELGKMEALKSNLPPAPTHIKQTNEMNPLVTTVFRDNLWGKIMNDQELEAGIRSILGPGQTNLFIYRLEMALATKKRAGYEQFNRCFDIDMGAEVVQVVVYVR